MRCKLKLGIVTMLVVALIIGSSFCGAWFWTKHNATEHSTTEAIASETSGGIAIPGYEEIRLKADQTTQSVSFYNPDDNNCYFVISLFIGNTELYTSEMIAPGGEITEIELIQPLSHGVYYEGIIRYSCYDLDTMEKLNGADVVTRLEVDL